MAELPNGQLVKKPDGVAMMAGTLEKLKPQLALALPSHVKADKLIRVVLTELRRNDDLLKCHTASVLGCVMTAAQLGLEIGAHLGHAYLIPYKKECTLIIGYKGLCELVYRSGHVSGVWARVVRTGDVFEWEEGSEPKLVHKPSVTGGEVTHAYAVVKMKDGFTRFEVMTLADVKEIKARSKAASDGPWVTDFPEMAKKTALRRICKTLPQSPELARAIAMDEAVDAGLPQVLAEVPAMEAIDTFVVPSEPVEPGGSDAEHDPGPPFGVTDKPEAA